MLETTQTLTISAGFSINIQIPNNDEGHGYFSQQGTVTVNGSEYTLTKGFMIENIEVGTIESVAGSELEIKYTHNEPAENKLRFFSRTGERLVIMIVNVPIHDHSSIVQGGPAFGTYFAEVENT